ncbi:hypothetical protein AVEN_80718-1 [Araneus ventricosus]|uniref:RNase H type-1 domain-containing protein n=1 Tax=Araneus ventricosus TaxID=182803 RepID=A0A4Y2H2E5_ARAVE|nr:hypothetical protein AVEN_80718-1 [Araneus ventricosus]
MRRLPLHCTCALRKEILKLNNRIATAEIFILTVYLRKRVKTCRHHDSVPVKWTNQPGKIFNQKKCSVVQEIKVWSDSESSLHSIASIDTKSPIAQQTQEILLKSTNIKLGWIKAHVGYSGNEAADVLAKKATQEGIPTFIPAPRNHIKSLLQKESIIRWQKEWDNGETGRSVHNVLPKVKTTPTPWQRPEIMFVTGHGPFPTYLKRVNIRSSDSCGCGKLGNSLHYATSACLQRHST